jgi:hypothetical protein
LRTGQYSQGSPAMVTIMYFVRIRNSILTASVNFAMKNVYNIIF